MSLSYACELLVGRIIQGIFLMKSAIQLVQNLSNQKIGHTTGDRDEAAHGGAAGRGGDVQDGTPTGRFAQDRTDSLSRHIHL